METKTCMVKLNLTALQNAGLSQVIAPNGKTVKVACIPIEDNNIFVSNNGAMYLSLQAFLISEEKQKIQNEYKSTHLIKMMIPKEKFNTMTEDEKRALPIIGNIQVWCGADQHPTSYQQTSQQPQPAYQPQQQAAPQQQTNRIPESHSDLPF